MRAIVTPDDLKKGDLVEPAWYAMELIDYREEEAKSDKSVNGIFQFKIIDGAFKGVSPRIQFNEKALGYGKQLWEAFGIPKTEEGGYSLTTEMFKACIGKKVKGYVKRGKSTTSGKEFNELTEFMPLS